VAASASAAITVDTVYVGNAVNANDWVGYGGVGYGYSIGKYEVTLNQYCAFLNGVAAADTYGLYNSSMASNPYVMGISQGGVSGSYSYSVIGSGNRPVTFVSWFDAARFANWLQNGQPRGAQGAGTTETGAYTLNGAMSGVFMRNPDARYGLPSENEWYKAAYYDPSLNLGSGGYWTYPTRSNVQPNSRFGSATDPNSANYYYDDGIANGYNGGFAVNNATSWPSGNALTDAGAFSLAASFYGTFDQGGNAQEWNDAVFNSGFGLQRGDRGGSWNSRGGGDLNTSIDRYGAPTNEDSTTGFRIVLVPEPSALVLIALGGAAFALRSRRVSAQ
jgi:formylglycine-generating enzyme